MDIMKWLSETVKNIHWFKTRQEWQVQSLYLKQYNEAVSHLAIGISKESISRDDYLKWRTEWRSTYQRIGEDIRASKVHRKTTVFGYDVGMQNIARARALRGFASRLMVLRETSKELAEKSYQRELEAA